MRGLAIAGIRAYRAALSPFSLAACRFEPTCSHYGEDAVRKYGTFKGGWLTLKRLARCRPFGGRGYDPVP